MNTKFVSHNSIYLQLANIYKKKIKLYNEKDIGRWCHEVERDYLKDIEHRLFFEGDVEKGLGKLKVENKRAIAPRNVFKIQSVFDKYNSPVGYYYDGIYINLDSDYKEEEIYVSYHGIPIDLKTGYPLIKEPHRTACYYYCRNKMFEEDYAEGKIPENRWHRWQNEFSQSLMAVDSSIEMDKEDFELIQRIIMTNVTSPHNYPFL